MGPAAPADPLRALREAEERYRLAARATDDVIWDYDLVAATVRWNEALTRRFGHRPNDMVTPIAWWEANIHPDDMARVTRSLGDAIDGRGEYWSQEYRLRRADGAYAEVLDRGYVIRDDGGRVTRMVGAILDLTDRKAADRRLRDSEETLRLAQAAAGIGSFEWNVTTGQARATATALAILGMPPADSVDMYAFTDMVHPDDRQAIRDYLAKAAAGEIEGTIEFRFVRPADQAMRWLRVSGSRVDVDEAATRRVGIVEDITDRKLGEAALRESEENYRFTVELSPQLAWTADPDGSNIEFKREMPGFGGAPGPEATDDWTDARTHPDDLAYRRRGWAHSLRSGRPYDAEFRIRRDDGEYRWVRSRGYPRRDADGRIVKWYGVTEDVHAQRAAEQQLQRVQAELSQVARVSAMGTLAATLAHELNQPLTAVANYMAGSKRLLENHGAGATAAIAEALDNAAKAAVQAGEIVRRLRDLVSRGDVNKQRVELADLVRQACELTFGDGRGRSIELSLEFGPHTRYVLADRIQLQQVLVNLLRNAAEAMTDSPTKVIELSAMPSGDDQVTVRIEDRGPGVAADVKHHLFSPFVTTKATGMGVGLSICRSIIEAHGGQLWVEDPPAGGAAFCLTLQRPVDD